jgi:hypothetical protein
MNRRMVTIVSAAAALALGGAGWAIAGGGDDEGPSQTGPGADRATAAALAHLGGGTANAVERDSENGATWEVEVTKSNGDTVDVRLDANYEVVVVEGDTEDADGEDSGSDD